MSSSPQSTPAQPSPQPNLTRLRFCALTCSRPPLHLFQSRAGGACSLRLAPRSERCPPRGGAELWPCSERLSAEQLRSRNERVGERQSDGERQFNAVTCDCNNQVTKAAADPGGASSDNSPRTGESPNPAARAGFHQLVARKGGTQVGLGLPGLRRCEAGRGAVGSHDPQPPLFPLPLSHTHLSSTT